MKIIECNEDFDEFLTYYNTEDSILIPVVIDDEIHPAINKISFIYIYLLSSNSEYIIPFYHNDCICLDYNILPSLNNDRKKYVYDKKHLLHLINLQNVIDIKILYLIEKNENLIFDNSNITEQVYKRRFYKSHYINIIIPITKYYENLTKLKDLYLDIIKKYDKNINDKCFNYLNDNKVNVFYNIEASGIYVDDDLFNNVYKAKNNIIINHLTYSNYNLFTITGRPSNTFNGINYGAMSKTDDSRLSFVSRFKEDGALLLFDYDAFHLRLISNYLIQYDSPKISFHEYLAKQYFNINTISEQQYEQSKQITFKLLYGNMKHSIPFFNAIHSYSGTLLNKYLSYDNVLKSYLFHQPLKFGDITQSNIIFNYLLQNLETEHNIIVLNDIFKLLKNKQSKLILYTYDSFLFDVHKNELSDLYENIKNILEVMDHKFLSKIYIGRDYKNMKKIL